MKPNDLDADYALAQRTTRFYPGLLTFLQSPEGHRLSTTEILLLVKMWDSMQWAYGATSPDEGARVQPRCALDWSMLLRMAREDFLATLPWKSHVTSMVNYAVGTTGHAVRTVASLARAPRKPSARAIAEARSLIREAHGALRGATTMLDALELPRARETARLAPIGGQS